MKKFDESHKRKFKKFVDYWVSFFGLRAWDVDVLFEDNLYHRGAECRIRYNIQSVQIVLYITNEIVKDGQEEDYLNWVACHEVSHIVTAGFVHKMKDDDEATRLCEEVSNRLANTLCNYKKGTMNETPEKIT
jgi:hypothetical protein